VSPIAATLSHFFSLHPCWAGANATQNHSSYARKSWIWNWDDDQLAYETNDHVRFEVADEEWHDQTPKGPNQSEDTNKTPYRIRGSMVKEGLGMINWWDLEGDEEEEGQEGQEGQMEEQE
jgi:DNA-directed RNA polymerase III subunit RPC8